MHSDAERPSSTQTSGWSWISVWDLGESCRWQICACFSQSRSAGAARGRNNVPFIKSLSSSSKWIDAWHHSCQTYSEAHTVEMNIIKGCRLEKSCLISTPSFKSVQVRRVRVTQMRHQHQALHQRFLEPKFVQWIWLSLNHPENKAKADCYSYVPHFPLNQDLIKATEDSGYFSAEKKRSGQSWRQTVPGSVRKTKPITLEEKMYIHWTVALHVTVAIRIWKN